MRKIFIFFSFKKKRDSPSPNHLDSEENFLAGAYPSAKNNNYIL